MDTGRLNYSRIAKLAMTPICQYLAEHLHRLRNKLPVSSPGSKGYPKLAILIHRRSAAARCAFSTEGTERSVMTSSATASNIPDT